MEKVAAFGLWVAASITGSNWHPVAHPLQVVEVRQERPPIELPARYARPAPERCHQRGQGLDVVISLSCIGQHDAGRLSTL